MTRTVTIAATRQGGLETQTEPEPGLAPVEGLPIAYAQLAAVEDGRATIARGRIEAKTTVSFHASPSRYALFVLSGHGWLTLGASDGSECDRLRFEPDMLILFPPGAEHGWIVEPGEPFKWLGIEFPAS